MQQAPLQPLLPPLGQLPTFGKPLPHGVQRLSIGFYAHKGRSAGLEHRSILLLSGLIHVQHALQFQNHPICTGQITLVYHENIADFQNTGLAGLHIISQAGNADHSDHIGTPGHSHFGLPHTYGLQNDIGKAAGIQHPENPRRPMTNFIR